MINHDNQYISSEKVPHRDRELLAGVAGDFGSVLTRSWGNLQYAILQSTPELREEYAQAAPSSAVVPPSPEVAAHIAGISPAEEVAMEQRAYEAAAAQPAEIEHEVHDADFLTAARLQAEQAYRDMEGSDV